MDPALSNTQCAQRGHAVKGWYAQQCWNILYRPGGWSLENQHTSLLPLILLALTHLHLYACVQELLICVTVFSQLPLFSNCAINQSWTIFSMWLVWAQFLKWTCPCILLQLISKGKAFLLDYYFIIALKKKNDDMKSYVTSRVHRVGWEPVSRWVRTNYFFLWALEQLIFFLESFSWFQTSREVLLSFCSWFYLLE